MDGDPCTLYTGRTTPIAVAGAATQMNGNSDSLLAEVTLTGSNLGDCKVNGSCLVPGV